MKVFSHHIHPKPSFFSISLNAVLTCRLQTVLIDSRIETSFQFKILGYILEKEPVPSDIVPLNSTIPGSYGSASPGRTSPLWGCPGWPPPPPRCPPSPPPCSPAPPSPPSAVVTPCTAEARVRNRFCGSNATVIVRLGGQQWSAEPATQTETGATNTWVRGNKVTWVPLGTWKLLLPVNAVNLVNPACVSGQLVGVRQTGRRQVVGRTTSRRGPAIQQRNGQAASFNSYYSSRSMLCYIA